jgi:hypothetical protein
LDNKPLPGQVRVTLANLPSRLPIFRVSAEQVNQPGAMFRAARRNSFCVFAVNLPRNRVADEKELPEDLVAAWTSVLLHVFEN